MTTDFNQFVKNRNNWRQPEKNVTRPGRFSFLRGVSKKDVADVTRQLAAMVQAGSRSREVSKYSSNNNEIKDSRQF